jgi:hypothetical protein
VTNEGRRATGLRISWTLIDQGISSLTNLLVGLAVASSTPQEEFGAFGAAFLAYLLAMGAARAAVTEIIAIRHTASDPDTYRSIARNAVGASMAAGVLAAVPVAGVALWSTGPLRDSLLVLCIALPGLLGQDAWRYVFFAQQEPKRAALNDGAWALAQLIPISIIISIGSPSASLLILVWGLSAWFALGVGCLQFRALPAVIAGIGWTYRNLRLGGGHLLGDWGASHGLARVTDIGVTVVLGLEALAAYRGATLLVGPLTILFTGASSFLVPEGSRAFHTRPERLRPLLRAGAGLLVAASLVWITTLTVLPDAIGERLLGDTWPASSKLLLWVSLTLPSAALINVAVAGIRTVGAVERGLRLRLATTPFMSGATFTAAALGGVGAMVRTDAAVTAAFALLWWSASNRTVRTALASAA